MQKFTGNDDMTHGWLIHILKGNDDMTGKLCRFFLVITYNDNMTDQLCRNSLAKMIGLTRKAYPQGQ